MLVKSKGIVEGVHKQKRYMYVHHGSLPPHLHSIQDAHWHRILVNCCNTWEFSNNHCKYKVSVFMAEEAGVLTALRG